MDPLNYKPLDYTLPTHVPTYICLLHECRSLCNAHDDLPSKNILEHVEEKSLTYSENRKSSPFRLDPRIFIHFTSLKRLARNGSEDSATDLLSYGDNSSLSLPAGEDEPKTTTLTCSVTSILRTIHVEKCIDLVSCLFGLDSLGLY